MKRKAMRMDCAAPDIKDSRQVGDLSQVRNRARPRIAYLTSNDPKDRKSWSGTHYSMATALQRHCGDVILIGPIEPPLEMLRKAIRRGLKVFTGKTYLYTHTIRFSRQIARIAAKRMAGEQFDFIVAPAGSGEIANLKTDLPVVYLSDATFASVLSYYPEFSRVLKGCIRDANTLEQSAIDRASLILYSSSWAADSACRDYNADPNKVRVVPFGANLEEPPDAEKVLTKVLSDTCKMLFVGVDWEKKGGKIAFETLVELERLGIPAQLTIVGCVPPSGIRHKNLRVVGSLDKNDSDQRRRLYQLYWDAHFFLLPTRADCSPIVLCEANAFGLPAITTDTGGIADIIENGRNGYRLPLSARGREYAELIAETYSNKARYGELRRNSRAAYDSKLNWDAWGIAVDKLVRDAIGYGKTGDGMVAETGFAGKTCLPGQPDDELATVEQEIVQGGNG
jgi:glycosyltransferase involved in cell wall biosynthesis